MSPGQSGLTTFLLSMHLVWLQHPCYVSECIKNVYYRKRGKRGVNKDCVMEGESGELV